MKNTFDIQLQVELQWGHVLLVVLVNIAVVGYAGAHVWVQKALKPRRTPGNAEISTATADIFNKIDAAEVVAIGSVALFEMTNRFLSRFAILMSTLNEWNARRIRCHTSGRMQRLIRQLLPSRCQRRTACIEHSRRFPRDSHARRLPSSTVDASSGIISTMGTRYGAFAYEPNNSISHVLWGSCSAAATNWVTLACT